MSNMSLFYRLFYLACELKPPLPSPSLMGYLGKTWSQTITAGAMHGLGGSGGALPATSLEQLATIYEAGSESGASPSLEEFRSTLATIIHEKICGNDAIPTLDQIKLTTQLGKWYAGLDSSNGDDIIDFDAEVETPMFTKSGFWPFDRIAGKNGLPQEVITILGKPGTFKTTWLALMAIEWRRQDIGPVIFAQTELAKGAMRMKIDALTKPGEKLWRSGVDQMVFGRRKLMEVLEDCERNPDPDRLVIVDSVTGYAGQGDTPDSRSRFADLYHQGMATKNSSRMAVFATHVKRGQDMMDIESAAGSSAVERFSGLLITLEKDDAKRPDGFTEVWIDTVKNRYSDKTKRFKVAFDYKNGKVYDADEDELNQAVYNSNKAEELE